MAFRKIVVKIGTTTLTGGEGRLSRRRMIEVVRQLASLHESGCELLVITSGSIAAGRELYPGERFSPLLAHKQMLSSIGQVRLMEAWTQLFQLYEMRVGQVLLSRADFRQREHYLNVREVFAALLQRRIIPVVNENDAVATREIRFGDNDNLGAMVSNLVGADLYIMITDCDGLYTSDPALNPQAKRIEVVEKIEEEHIRLAGGSRSRLGTGGMATKIEAAQLATSSGVEVVIGSLQEENFLLRAVRGDRIGSRFLARTTPMESRKRWLLAERPTGRIYVDAGAAKGLSLQGASLLPAGVLCIEGEFDRGAVVEITEHGGDTPFAKGVVRYASHDLLRIAKLHSSEIADRLGYTYGEEAIHRNDLILLESSL